jgi:hypothetical protein
VSRVLLAQQDEIGQVVRGAYDYFHTIGTGAASLTKLPDGSTYAYFNTFLLFSDVNALVCNLLTPDTSGMSFLAPIQQALSGAGSAFNCSSEMAAFDKAQSADGTSTSPIVSETSTVAAQAASTQLYGIVGAPDKSKASGISGYINNLLGGTS